MSNCISKFIEKFKPVVNLQKPDEEILNFGKQMLPKEIIELWEEYGFGEYGDGLLKVVDPREYMNSLYTWLGQKDFNKIPIIVTAFGDIFYYRKVEACGYSYQEFFEKYILDEDIIKNVLRADLYKQAVKELGKLDYKDIFFFIPALVLGGREELKYIKKGNGAVHHQVLLQIGQEE